MSWCPSPRSFCSTSMVRSPRIAASRAIARAVDATPDDQEIGRVSRQLLPARRAPGIAVRMRPSTWFLWHAHRIRSGGACWTSPVATAGTVSRPPQLGATVVGDRPGLGYARSGATQAAAARI